jgi:hypothetical protein
MLYIYFFPVVQQPLVVQGLPIIDASRSHSLRLLWSSDQPEAETSTWQLQHTQGTDIRAPLSIRTRSPIKGAADRPLPTYIIAKIRLHVVQFLVLCAYIAALFLLLRRLHPDICLYVIIFKLEWISVRMLIKLCSLHDKPLWCTNIWL